MRERKFRCGTKSASKIATSSPVAVVSHGYWRSAYGGSSDIVGRTLSLNGQPFDIIGVAGEGFSGLQVGRATEVYVPLCTMPIVQGGQDRLDDRTSWLLYVFGRLRPGLTTEAAGRRLAALAPAIFGATVPEDWPTEAQEDYRRTTLTAVPGVKVGHAVMPGRPTGCTVVLLETPRLGERAGRLRFTTDALPGGGNALGYTLLQGAGGGPHIRVFDGSTGAQVPGAIGSPPGEILTTVARRVLARE